MSKFKRIARLAAGAILVTGIVTSVTAPADAAPDSHSARWVQLDTGWGG